NQCLESPELEPVAPIPRVTRIAYLVQPDVCKQKVAFVQWCRQNSMADPFILISVLTTDEAYFTREDGCNAELWWVGSCECGCVRVRVQEAVVLRQNLDFGSSMSIPLMIPV
ncbi:hypothetical protein AVEN_82739-1, partial [Araneus ventricosus]